jgi:hypothetical protein
VDISMSQTPINRKQIAQLIKKTTKKVIAEGGINPSTRSGNQELEYVVKRLATQPFSSLEVAEALGEALGQKIVALSQQMGKQNLDRAVIWKLVAQKDLPVIVEDTPASTPKTTSQAAAKHFTTSSPTKVVEEAIVEEAVTVHEPAVSEDPLVEVSKAPVTSAVASAVTTVDQAADEDTIAAITEDITNDIPEIEDEEDAESPVAEIEASDRAADPDLADAEAIEPITELEDGLEVDEIGDEEPEKEIEDDEIEPITELEDEDGLEVDETVAELEDEIGDEFEDDEDDEDEDINETENEAAIESVAELEANEIEANEIEANEIEATESEETEPSKAEAEFIAEIEPTAEEENSLTEESLAEEEAEEEPSLSPSRDR